MESVDKAKLTFLIFLTTITYPSYNPYLFIFYMIIKYLGILKERQVYTLFPVDDKLIRKYVHHLNIDINNTVLFYNSNVTNSAKIALIRDETSQRLNRKVIVVSTNLQSAENTSLMISNILFNNLKGASKCCFKPCPINANSQQYADEVELSLVCSENEWAHFTIDTCLKNYFQIPRLLYVGDIIEISLNDYGKDVFYSSNRIVNINKNLYFKCNKIVVSDKNVSGGYFCVTGKFILKQSRDVQSFLPKSVDASANLGVAPFPEAFSSYFLDIRKAICPFLGKRKMDFKPSFLLEGRRGCGKSLLVECIASHFGMHLYTINNFELTANVYAQNETKLRNAVFGAKIAAPSILLIKNFENFGKNNEGQYDERLINHFTLELSNLFDNEEFPVFLFCCSNEKQIPVEIRRMFLKTVEIKAPNEEERENMLEWLLKSNSVQSTININNIANKTHGFLLEDLRALVHYAVTDFCKENPDVELNVSENYFMKALDFMQSNYNDSLGAAKVPKVKWSDVGGLNEVKDEIIKTIKLPLRNPQFLKASGLKRSGILLYGPPGTGKTLIAKAVATECGLCFLSVKGPELLNMYVGQSEQNVREVFERAREASPCIIFFDELDSLAPNRGISGDSGGVMDRVVSQLLAEMDGLNRTATIFIIGATNRPDLIDPALLRPGRFDKLLYVGPCLDKDSKTSVLQALTQKFKFSDDKIIEKVVDLCPENYSGADFYGLCSSAWMSAVRRLIISIEDEGGKSLNCATLDNVIVTLDDFKFAIKNIKPSIKQEDLEYFHKLKSELK